MRSLVRFLLVASCSLLTLWGCSASNSHQDLRDFIAENKRRPPGKIPEPPKIKPYNAFQYDAYQLRSPFSQPIPVISSRSVASASSQVKPDLTRQKERLEQYDLDSLSMVGTLSKQGVTWALISDPDGSIERVRPGSYMGRNHGKVVSLSPTKIDLIEIVASGEGWLERPNVLELETADSP